MVNLKKEEAKLDSREVVKKEEDFREKALSSEFKNAILFELSDTIKADFNGDGNPDQAIFTKGPNTGITIQHGKTNEVVRLGFGKPLAHLTDFDWVDFWGLVQDADSYQMLVEQGKVMGDTMVQLENPSIVVRQEESGGGLITFKEGAYRWIHQAD
ncbi:MAG: hypothetical protein AAF990_27925, partial [Bacteroidota bacterium]